jgi:flagellar basal body L-ring protein FlgH
MTLLFWLKPYGGRGTATDVQSPRWGQQFMDILLPF